MIIHLIRASLLFCGIWVLSGQLAHATFSIVACDKETSRCGVAVATHNLAVGDGVPFAQAGIGAGVSQFETNPLHSKVILNALTRQMSADDALAEALKSDGEYEDGNELSVRQIGIVSFQGNAAAFTGDSAMPFSGHRADGYVSVQGNGLVSKTVVDEMWDSFHKTERSLEERLMTALEAGEAAGGQMIGVTSAALLVSTEEGWPVDTDLRVDFNTKGTAVGDLRTAFNANIARQYLFRARHLLSIGNEKQAQLLVDEALRRAPEWDRIWLNAGWLAEESGQMELAKDRFCRFQTINPVWAKHLGDKIDFSKCAHEE